MADAYSAAIFSKRFYTVADDVLKLASQLVQTRTFFVGSTDPAEFVIVRLINRGGSDLWEGTRLPLLDSY